MIVFPAGAFYISSIALRLNYYGTKMLELTYKHHFFALFDPATILEGKNIREFENC